MSLIVYLVNDTYDGRTEIAFVSRSDAEKWRQENGTYEYYIQELEVL